MSFRLPITVKLCALIVLAVVITAFAVNQVYLRGSNRILLEQAVTGLEDESQSFAYPLSADIDQLQDDTRLLSSLRSAAGFARAEANHGRDPETGVSLAQAEDALGAAFVEMLRTHDQYSEVRFIGTADGGREIIKVQRIGNRILRAPAEKLALQGGEPFFQEALASAPGSVRLSEADLYRENGKPTEPHMLVLRGSTALRKPGQEVLGAIVINMDLGRVLGDIRRNLSPDRTLYVTNSRGDYLVNPDPARLFATDLGTDWRLQSDVPALLPAMNRSGASVVTLMPRQTGTDDVITFRKVSYDPADPRRYLGIAVKAPYSAITARTGAFRKHGLLLTLVISVVAAIVGVLLLRLSLRPLNTIAEAVLRYRKGEKNIALPEDSPDEIGLLSREFLAMMRQKDEEAWVRESLVSSSRHILGFSGLEAFADAVIRTLATTAGAEVGVFYVSDGFMRGAGGGTAELVLAGSFGLSGRAGVPVRLALGEGIVGQCARDRSVRHLRDVPDGYLGIASALGRTAPREILLLPVVLEDTLAGVIELAALSAFSAAQCAFLEHSALTVAITLNSIAARMRTEELLEDARQQTEELQRSEEELKAQQEELESANAEMEQRTRELEALNRRIADGNQRLTGVVESALDGIITIDAKGIVESFNPASERLFGYRASEVVGRNVGMLMPEPYRGEHDGYLARYQAGGKARILGAAGDEIRALRKDGSTFPMELSVSAFELGGQRHFSGTVRDITERREAEARLEAASRYKSEFLANMSHELRTPLNSLLILARSLAANEEGNLTPEQVEEAEVIHSGGIELLGLINDILDLSKVEAGKLSFVADEVPIDDLVRRLRQQFDPIAGETGVAFRIELAAGLPDAIHTDGHRVEQILKNLIANGFKFTEKGSVTLAIYQPKRETDLFRDTLRPGSTIAFAVTDTGIGIDPARLNDIFEAFQQEDGSIDRHYGGTGLGLTIARKFAHMLGGEVHVESAKGEGSTFTLMLPLTWEAKAESGGPAPLPAPAPACEPELAPPRPLPPPFVPDDRDNIAGGDRVLLVIEDDRHFAATLVKMARKRGYKCLAAGDGKTGMLLATEQPVSAVILDLTLPDIDGITVLDQLKGNLSTRHIPVHIVTGRAAGENVFPLRRGAVGYLTKPVEMADLDAAFARIEDLLSAEVKKILVVEDDGGTQVAIRSLLAEKDVEIVCTATGRAALELVGGDAFDCVILDLALPDMTGFAWLEAMERQADGREPPPVIVYTARDLTEDEDRALNCYTGSIVIKGASSAERLLDEVTLFLHSVEATLTSDQQAMIRMQHDPDKVLAGRKVLLVDDDMRNIFALSRLLKKHGMHVVIADNGEMALDKLAVEDGIELVIMDIMMPVMDGYQAIGAIRARPEFAELPVIALTARAMPEEQDRCIAAGANDYLAKPVDIERLLTLLRVWLFRQEEAA